MQLNELKAGDIIIAKYGGQYRKMNVLANDTEREQLTADVVIDIGTLSDIKQLEVLRYDSYNLKDWGRLETITNQ